MNVQFLVPASLRASGIATVLNDALRSPVLTPFDPALTDFVADFAKSILLDRQARAYPELVVLANFFRSVNIGKLKQELAPRGADLCMARGLVFHIAPSNVDSVFLYSSLLSFLCGNVNLIRISRSAGEQVGFILAKLAQLADRHAAVAGRLVVLSYEHDDAITSLISEQCHLRVVWGGDATVRKIRSLPLRPTAAELCFPDRFSSAMLVSERVERMDEAELEQLCGRFFNDAIWFAQQACSSPRLVAWVGSEECCEAARSRFWQAFDAYCRSKDVENTAGMAMDRFVAACMVATEPVHRATVALAFPTRILLQSGPVGIVKHFHCGNGLFYEQCFSDIPAFLETLTDREQTLAVFGAEAQEMAGHLRRLPMRALDRVTHIGHALDFSHVWDGYNLLHAFTRQVGMPT